jgi:hypothetical protein
VAEHVDETRRHSKTGCVDDEPGFRDVGLAYRTDVRDGVPDDRDVGVEASAPEPS